MNTSEKKLYNHQYYISNKDNHYHTNKLWRLKNKDKDRLYSKRWRANHPDKCRARKRRRRARELAVNENYTTADEQYTKALFGDACVNCGSTQNLCIDHHYPLSHGHALSRQNAVVLCASCNSSKNNKLPEDFYTEDKLQYIQEKLTLTPA